MTEVLIMANSIKEMALSEAKLEIFTYGDEGNIKFPFVSDEARKMARKVFEFLGADLRTSSCSMYKIEYSPFNFIKVERFYGSFKE